MPSTHIPGLRSPYDTVGGIVQFGRMLDKIRLHAAGKLPDGWVEAMGVPKGYDARCCRFLHIDYADLTTETLKGGSDDELLAWAFSTGRQPNDEEIEVWNGFMMKIGWRDAYTARVVFRLEESKFAPDAVLTMFDFIDLDEGRPPRFS